MKTPLHGTVELTPRARVLVGLVEDAPAHDSTVAVGRMKPREIPTIEAAQLLRSELRTRYPGSQFSVRCGTGYCSRTVYITYLDGPPADEVEVLADAYRGYESIEGGDYGDWRPFPGQWVGGEFIWYNIQSIFIERDTSAQRAGAPADVEHYLDAAVRREGNDATIVLALATGYLGLSAPAVVKLLKAGTIKATKSRDNRWRIDVASLRAYARSRDT